MTSVNTVEQWTKVIDWPCYSVSNFGRIRNDKTGKVLKEVLNAYGYAQVTLSEKGRKKILLTHILVCIAFNGSKPSPSSVVRHKDSRRSNNHSNNLVWGTRAENGEDMRDAKSTAGENNGMAKLSWDEVRAIRMKAPFTSLVALAKEYGVGTAAISNIVTGKSWKE